jgi:hypothetical protein
LIEDSSLVCIAPEAIAGNAAGGVEFDVFSLGALTCPDKPDPFPGKIARPAISHVGF